MISSEINLKNLIADLQKKKNAQKAKDLARFFKTGKGEYGAGDFFLGIVVPETRQLAKKYQQLPLGDIQKLLKNKYHEARLLALFILVQQYRKTQNEKEQKQIVTFYLKNTKHINNWDLVDLSSHYILGNYLISRDRRILKKLAQSKNIWERRIAILSTFAFIYQGEFKDTFEISKMLLKDEHDLIHKAVGWMLREVGKRVSEKELENFLEKYARQMPRTMLRYSLEKFPEAKRKKYLRLK